MITDTIHTEVLLTVKYKNNKLIQEDLIDKFIKEVEIINSLFAGGVGNYAFSAYKENIGAMDLISIINNHIAENIENISKYKIKILRY